MGVPCRIRGVAKLLLVFTLLGATPVATLAEAALSPCEAHQHECEAPSIGTCCCRESVGGALPATNETGRGTLISSPAVALVVEPELATGLILSRGWFRLSTRAAGPPQPLHLLYVSILR